MAANYLDEIENMLLKVETTHEYSYLEVLAALRSCYWLFREYLRLEERYDKALKNLEELAKSNE